MATLENERKPVITPASDISPTVRVTITHYYASTGKRITYDLNAIKDYSYDSDILTLNDCFALTVPNVEGTMSEELEVGDSVTFYVNDPSVIGGRPIQKLRGIITALNLTDDKDGGANITIQGSDLGWHLVNNCAPLFLKYESFKWEKLLNAVIHPSWGFAGTQTNYNLQDLNIKIGRAEFTRQIKPLNTVFQPIQFEPGQNIADVLMPFAKRAKVLLNVTADGYLQVFQPNNSGKALYRFHHHRTTEQNRVLNNVISANLTKSIDGIYSYVTCVGQTTEISQYLNADTALNPNAPFKRGNYKASPNPLPFQRYVTFPDSDQFESSTAAQRAKWKWQRGQFDSWCLNYTVQGHSQIDPDGRSTPYVPDTICEVNDTVLGVQGRYYISAVHYSRTPSQGTETILTIRKPDLLGA